MDSLTIIVLAVASVSAFLIPIVLIAGWILKPLDRAAKFRRAPVRFSIGDFLCLFLAIQIPLSAVYRFIEPGEESLFWLFFIITWIVGPLIWYSGARTLSKAGVVRGAHRFAFLGLVMPLVYYGFLPFSFLTMTILLNLVGVEDFSIPRMGWVWGSWIFLATLYWLSGALTRVMVLRASANHPRSEEFPESSG
jgi:hypothetical protein